MQGIRSIVQTLLVLCISASASAIAASPQDSLAATDSFVIYLDQKGNVWTWGEDVRGSMGLGSLSSATQTAVKSISQDVKHVLTPQRLALENVKAIRANRNNAYAITSDGSLWVWGFYSNSGITGSRTIDETLPNLTRYGELEPIDRLYTHKATTFAFTQDNHVYMWGGMPNCNPMFDGWGGQIGIQILKIPGIDSVLIGGDDELVGLRKFDSEILACARPAFRIIPGTKKLGPKYNNWQYSQVDSGDWYRSSSRFEERLTGLGNIQEIEESQNLLVLLQSDGNLLIWNDTQNDYRFTSKLTVPAKQTRLFQPPEPITHINGSTRNGLYALGKSGKVYMHTVRALPVNRNMGPRGWVSAPEFFKIFDPHEITVSH